MVSTQRTAKPGLPSADQVRPLLTTDDDRARYAGTQYSENTSHQHPYFLRLISTKALTSSWSLMRDDFSMYIMCPAG